ncbi:hypothetical protein J2X69_002097 [Algoriphagus sp. 4150]|uniref:DUF6090 family protein n=1 Tax=Algoriphagus sp. 4150 TaxID=2817756 RepID=UPI0028585DEA|nr:DUF6090 family protein [Algoriphagus sp. 4150]MDR7129752.1 hypothetical protein [Algoriphagus sp. 4150]
MKGKNFFLNQLNQFIPVVLGVYVGILASNWNENRMRRVEQNEYIENLKLEIQANKVKLEEALTYQKDILQSTRQIKKELDRDILEGAFWKMGHWTLIPDWEGLKIPKLENAVHQSGIMTNSLSGLDFHIIHTISQSYSHQDDYKLYAQRLILDNLTLLDNQIKTVEVLNKLEVWQDVMNIEKELIEHYNETLEKLGK